MQPTNVLETQSSPCYGHQVLTIADERDWRDILPTNVSVFGGVEFASIVERYMGHSARLFVFSQDDSLIAYPLFLRPVSDLPFAAALQIQAWDSLSPEYTGPLPLNAVSRSAADRFRSCFAEYCRRERIVAEFAHLHPWSWSGDLLNEEGLSRDREIVYVDLTLSEEQIWQESFSPSCRNKIRQAQKENVRVFQATTQEHIRQFYGIYRQTMDRRQALAKYYFPLDYFIALFERMPENAIFFLAEYQNHIVCATLYLHDKLDAYSYLTGADHAFQHVRPTNAVVWEAIRWSQSRGKKRLILGGGYQPGDGVFRFKASFTPLRAHFHVYRRIQMENEYAALCRAWCAYYDRDLSSSGGYFPAYRSIPDAT